ncbi:MAG: di-trans,poly-cis-decaprenylcistransferase [Oscillospiraceae bacterium]|nr:di-trans,poly-cis-decaprenylcistransferase [Oscillospiraceae bacterium]
MKFSLFGRKKRGGAAETVIPRHIAVIMDGNGRWAMRRGLPRTAGHAAGAETFRRVATYCKEIGVEYLTVYAFSTENWQRPESEVRAIMELLERYLVEAIEKMERDRVKMKFFGDIEALNAELRALILRAEEISRRFEGVQVNICVNYGGRGEIVRAARLWRESSIAEIANNAELADNAELSEEAFGSFMYSAGMPDPDLVIRPGGETRVSNFLLWQSAYSELYFTDTLWPDFTPRELDKAIEAYNSRERRYGGVL